jgi:hypothetical protein
MRQLMLGTMTAALVALGSSAATFAAPVAHQFVAYLIPTLPASSGWNTTTRTTIGTPIGIGTETITGGTTTTDLDQRRRMIAVALSVTCSSRWDTQTGLPRFALASL